MRRMHILLIALLSVAALMTPDAVHAQAEFTDSVRTVSERFNSFRGEGFAPTPAAGQLDSDTWNAMRTATVGVGFGGTAGRGVFGRGTSNGGVGRAGVYAFDTSRPTQQANYALGVQPTGGDFNPGSLVFRVANNGSFSIDRVVVRFQLCVLNNAPRATTVRLGHTINGAATVVDDGAILTTPMAGSAVEWNCTSLTAQRIDDTIPAGQTIEIHWSFVDAGGSGARDEIALEDVSLSAPAFVPMDAGVPDAGPPDAGPPDAGPPPVDAGPPDAGPVSMDAGPAPTDAGASIDAGRLADAGAAFDAGAPDEDGGAAPADGGDGDGGGAGADGGMDGGVGMIAMETGCGCAVPGLTVPGRGRTRDRDGALAMLALLGLAMWRRRRRR